MQAALIKNTPASIFFAVYLVFLLAAFLLFWPVLDKSFLSDDYLILYRIVYNRAFYTADFFRPLSDLGLYLSYLAAGFTPFYYTAANIIVHASTAFLIYRLCRSVNFLIAERRGFFAWTASLLFLVYPFHNEAVVWAIGRGIVLSGFFGVLSLLVVFLNISPGKKITLSYIFYFIGLCGYETIIPLPAIVLLLLYAGQLQGSNWLQMGVGYLLVLLLNLGLRLIFSGAILSTYGNSMFRPSASTYAIKFFKATGKLLLPPSDSSLLLGIIFTLLLVVIVAISVVVTKRKNNIATSYTRLSLALLAAVVIPAMFGVSTKTFEGDRVLYFPSFLLCIWVAYLLSLIAVARYRIAGSLLLLGYCCFFFYQNITAWKEAGKNADIVLAAVAGIPHKEHTVYLLNMPEEYNGIPVFRRGFTEALLIRGIDTAGIRVVNYISTQEHTGLRQPLQPVITDSRLTIPPYASVNSREMTARKSYHDSSTRIIQLKSGDMLYYWNRNLLIKLPLPSVNK